MVSGANLISRGILNSEGGLFFLDHNSTAHDGGVDGTEIVNDSHLV